ncbi:peptidoglycan DD-metalloendopeptidase family protein [Zoogloea sp.]|uniref:M23 family metallopeptidase n=1 Tax=Zoogloea sp. TaxID=49181 RepID=UPI0025F62DCE|nr:peptidoglycan DD-metalloendopeptidase family protein [Zoogloea sp.]MCK6395940.1 peptidoglycan DD-metalloendopeptidase family protein [Zoogloea sp.]
MEIRAAVGAWEQGARNERQDVETVQSALTRLARQPGWEGADPEGVDGSIARPPRKSATVKAIRAFQVVAGLEPGGVLTPAGDGWRRLVQLLADTPRPPGGDAVFPFARPAVADWTHPPRSFGSRRSGGRRAHAGCDLYAPVGRAIHAVRDGVVIRDPYAFYAQTDALEIDHGDFVIRYGEIKPDCTLRKGEHVKAGQVIARVGLLVGIQVPSAMLHLEMYDGSGTGSLTVPENLSARTADGVPFLRRADLLDPTPFLNEWRKWLAGA